MINTKRLQEITGNARVQIVRDSVKICEKEFINRASRGIDWDRITARQLNIAEDVLYDVFTKLHDRGFECIYVDGVYGTLNEESCIKVRWDGKKYD